MPERKSKKATPNRKKSDDAPDLRKALTSRRKEELVSALLELAKADRRVLRQLTARFDVVTATDDLAEATRVAIFEATDFDNRDVNTNFDYDYEAYEEVKRNLARLIALGELRLAMQLSVELMKEGSRQVEMSDEGMMTQDIEDCLSVVFQAVKKYDLPADEVVDWCSEMRNNDRIGCIADKQLKSLVTTSRRRSSNPRVVCRVEKSK